MPLTFGDRDVRPLTADEVLRMVETGILHEDEKVELLGGVLTAVSPQGDEHAAVLQRLTRWLGPVLGAGRHDLRLQMPLRVPDQRSLPEPDVAVIPRTDEVVHPGTAELVIEVAVTSIRIDTRTKAALYAAAGVPEYWIVDVAGRRLRVLTEPVAEGYAVERSLRPGASARPVAIEAPPLALDALFAGIAAH